jgi:hypothetical protein
MLILLRSKRRWRLNTDNGRISSCWILSASQMITLPPNFSTGWPTRRALSNFQISEKVSQIKVTRKVIKPFYLRRLPRLYTHSNMGFLPTRRQLDKLMSFRGSTQLPAIRLTFHSHRPCRVTTFPCWSWSFGRSGRWNYITMVRQGMACTDC